MKNSHSFFFTQTGSSINRWLITLTLAGFAGCDLSPVKDEKAIAQVRSIGVCLVASRFVRVDGNVLYGVMLTKDSPTPYMVLLGDTVEAVDDVIKSSTRDGLSFVRIESLVEGVSSLDVDSAELYAKQKIDESDKFDAFEARRDASSSLAEKHSTDAILWINVEFDAKKKYAAESVKPLSPLISWQVELYGRDGRKLYADKFHRSSPDTGGNCLETQDNVSTMIDPVSYAGANRALAVELAKEGIGSLTQSISKARTSK